MTHNEFNDKIIGSLEHVRSCLSLSEKQMADKLCISLSTYKRIINREIDKIDSYILFRLSDMSGKDLSDLMNENTFGIREKLNLLSENQRTFINSVIDFELIFSNRKYHDNKGFILTVIVPTGNLEDGMLYDACNLKKIKIYDLAEEVKKRADYGIYLKGNAFHPVYNSGDIILVEKACIRDGDTGIFFNSETDCVYIRRYVHSDKIRLEPLNEFGRTILFDDHDKAWNMLGRVICKLRNPYEFEQR